ncbi:microcystin LR degradation protein MlrC [Petrimonas sp. IBARAKI]|nr:microcystin LR degradation protein MlrC [Petrimonas sp. IBARAKI]
MKKLFSTSLLLAILISAVECQNHKKKLPRIAIAGLAIESSTFSPAVSHEDAFRARYGDSVFSYYPFFAADSGIIDRAVWLPTLRGHAMPGGIVSREAYESLVSKTLDSLKAKLPLDALFFDVHGAMSVQGLDDPEGDFLVRIRELVGTDVLISTSMDLHGSVSPRLAQNTDLITCYRLAPHEDAIESKKRAVTNLLDRLENGKGKPAYKAWIPVPILLPGEKTSTRIEPGKSLYAQIPEVIEKDKVIDASIWMSYPWADEPRNHGVVVAYGDDKEAVGKAAEKLAAHFWNVRKEFDFVAPTVYLDEALEKALASDKKPFIISDMGDNPTAGGAGDVTWTLQEILKRPELKSPRAKSLIYASIPGEEFVKKAKEIGVGGKIDATAGAAVDNRFAPPVRITGTITAIHEGHPNAKTEVVVRNGNTSVIVTERRMAYHYEKDFTKLGLNPRETDILVVKIGYLVPELYDMRADWLMALTPGGVDQDLLRLDYKRINRPIYPLDPDMADPDLNATFIPLSDEIKR